MGHLNLLVDILTKRVVTEFMGLSSIPIGGIIWEGSSQFLLELQTAYVKFFIV